MSDLYGAGEAQHTTDGVKSEVCKILIDSTGSSAASHINLISSQNHYLEVKYSLNFAVLSFFDIRKNSVIF